MAEQKHYMDIERLKLGNGWGTSNDGGFDPGDEIQISEKWDGSNASIRYDAESGKIRAWSRKRELSFDSTLEGFWNWVQTLNPDDYGDAPNLTIFGEWGRRNKVRYRDDAYGKWYVYDIWDADAQKWLPQSEVGAFARSHGLEYIHVLYEGPFVSWEHCQSFCNSPAYGDIQEGVVVKNQTKLNNPDSRLPFYLKIVNESFSEVKRVPKQPNPERDAKKVRAEEIAESIVTVRRVEKELERMRDEELLPDNFDARDMGLVARSLPKRVHDDCLKEERELVEEAGEHFGKACSSRVMQIARGILLS